MAPSAQHPAVPPPLARPRIDRQGMAILMICASAFIFAAQDGISRYLGATYSPIFVIMLRYWFFAVFVVVICARAPGGLAGAVRTKRPWTQAFRGVLLAAEVIVTVEAFVRLGLINTHAIFACYPLLISALAGPVLGEKVGWRRWAAVAVGFLGILIVLKPGSGVFTAEAALPFAGCGHVRGLWVADAAGRARRSGHDQLFLDRHVRGGRHHACRDLALGTHRGARHPVAFAALPWRGLRAFPVDQGL